MAIGERSPCSIDWIQFAAGMCGEPGMAEVEVLLTQPCPVHWVRVGVRLFEFAVSGEKRRDGDIAESLSSTDSAEFGIPVVWCASQISSSLFS